jgi:hypothetical protein
MTRPAIGSRGNAWPTAVVADALVVVVFAAVGRASHSEHVGVAGVWHVAWPFLLATAAALAWAAYSKDDPRTLRVGVRVWLVTVVLGLVVRKVSGAGTAPSFVIVTALVLGALFIGWRLVVRVRRWTSPLRSLRR